MVCQEISPPTLPPDTLNKRETPHQNTFQILYPPALLKRPRPRVWSAIECNTALISFKQHITFISPLTPPSHSPTFQASPTSQNLPPPPPPQRPELLTHLLCSGGHGPDVGRQPAAHHGGDDGGGQRPLGHDADLVAQDGGPGRPVLHRGVRLQNPPPREFLQRK